MPRISDAKEKLTEAALGLIWTSGYGATSVDDICEKANVKKGSFYHFFQIEGGSGDRGLGSELAQSKQRWNDLFSPSIPPLERFQNYFDFVLQKQANLKAEYGSVLGLPVVQCGVGGEQARGGNPGESAGNPGSICEIL
jgi:TetR/AcrR family transcriptional repressor of nem operon